MPKDFQQHSESQQEVEKRIKTILIGNSQNLHLEFE